jgi:hypothetical protein
VSNYDPTKRNPPHPLPYRDVDWRRGEEDNKEGASMTQEKIQEIIDANTNETGAKDYEAIGRQIVWLQESKNTEK